eukprot:TRINITY_DN20404_c0_g1_i1.p2 TRINITY_DN20404_c0_g1~~TRINITY_DN20404_c0_g1_i1.p2  ORF type:complete len:155 (-),score=35.70 TRINITY_DN20404_c0_g1_i1:80-544(-)
MSWNNRMRYLEIIWTKKNEIISNYERKIVNMSASHVEQVDKLMKELQTTRKEFEEFKSKAKQKTLSLLHQSSIDTSEEAVLLELVDVRGSLLLTLDEMRTVGLHNAQSLRNLRTWGEENYQLKKEIERLKAVNHQILSENQPRKPTTELLEQKT